MKKLLVAVVFFCADAGALLSGDTLQGIASVINATKGNNNYQQQGYQNGTQQWGFFSPQAQKNTQVSLNQVQSQTATIFIQQGWSVEQNAILKNGSQILGYITNEGWVISPEGQVVYGPNDERRFQKFAVPKKIKNAFKKLGYVYQNTNQNNQQKGFVMASGGQQWIASQPVLNNGQPASSDPQALPRFLKIIGEMADDTMAILETNVANEKVRNLVYKLLKLMMQSCTQQSADRSKLMKMRDSILELAKRPMRLRLPKNSILSLKVHSKIMICLFQKMLKSAKLREQRS